MRSETWERPCWMSCGLDLGLRESASWASVSGRPNQVARQKRNGIMMKSKVSARMMNVQRLLRGGRFCGADGGASVKSVLFCEFHSFILGFHQPVILRES